MKSLQSFGRRQFLQDSDLSLGAAPPISALAPGDGYIFSDGHNLRADVPPANIVALFDTSYEAGRYPLAHSN